MNRKWLAVLLMILIVPLVGELNFYPFDREFSSFRVSFGSPTCESGCNDLLYILDYLAQYDNEESFGHEFPSLKDIFNSVAIKKLGVPSPDLNKIKKESKALEQRIRRALFQGLIHLASIGVTDYTNPKFEEYAPIFLILQK